MGLLDSHLHLSLPPPPLSPSPISSPPALFFLKPATSSIRPTLTLSLPLPTTPLHRPISSASVGQAQTKSYGENQDGNNKEEDLGEDGEIFRETQRLVECAMLAAVAGLAYFLSNSLALENYFGCFFPLPIVISSMRWGLSAGRKTMVATALLLLTLSGPVKALTYLLMYGVVGLVMGTLWRLETKWPISILLCTITRALGACGYVLVSSFLIRENILSLITINIHASLTYILTAIGVNTIPSMDVIYVIFGTLLLLNSGFFMFLLHLLYGIFLSKLGMRASLRIPRWLEKAV